MRFFTLAIMVLLFVPASSQAGKITNRDQEPHTIVITHVGNIHENITLMPNESYRFFGPWFELSLKGSEAVFADGAREFDIKNGKIVLMLIRDSKRAGGAD